MASALFGSTAIGYGDLFDRKVDDNIYYLVHYIFITPFGN